MRMSQGCAPGNGARAMAIKVHELLISAILTVYAYSLLKFGTTTCQGYTCKDTCTVPETQSRHFQGIFSAVVPVQFVYILQFV